MSVGEVTIKWPDSDSWIRIFLRTVPLRFQIEAAWQRPAMTELLNRRRDPMFSPRGALELVRIDSKSLQVRRRVVVVVLGGEDQIGLVTRIATHVNITN
jgi:hypothetical protein